MDRWCGRAGHRLRWATAGLAILAACTAGVPSADRTDPPADPPTRAPIVVGVVGTVAGSARPEDRPHLDGMALAEAEINGAGGIAGRPLELEVVDDGGEPEATSEALAEWLTRPEPVAFLVVGPSSAVDANRLAIQADGRPVILLGGDLYTPRALFPQAFQGGPPMRWQARIVARYLARDRGYERVMVVGDARQDAEDDAMSAALRDEGLRVTASPDPAAGEGEDAVVALVDPGALPGLVRAVRDRTDPPQLVLPADLLRSDLGPLPPGTVAPGTYTWAPWARPIPRVRRFRDRMERTIGHRPVGAEQEGHDALRLLADALDTTGARSGLPLVRALESNRPRGPTYSALPLVLGPDDHTLIDESWIGLFAVAGPGERAEPWMEGVPWRPIIRTFTYDGERTIFEEGDRRVFFPFWRKNRPSPKFGRARYGITTDSSDPLH